MLRHLVVKLGSLPFVTSLRVLEEKVAMNREAINNGLALFSKNRLDVVVAVVLQFLLGCSWLLELNGTAFVVIRVGDLLFFLATVMLGLLGLLISVGRIRLQPLNGKGTPGLELLLLNLVDHMLVLDGDTGLILDGHVRRQPGISV